MHFKNDLAVSEIVGCFGEVVSFLGEISLIIYLFVCLFILKAEFRYFFWLTWNVLCRQG